MDLKELWQKTLSEVELSVSKANFNTWFKNTSIAKEEDEIIFVGVPNAFVRDWLSAKHHKTILEILRTNASNVRGVEFVIERIDDKKKASESAAPSGTFAAQMPIAEMFVNKEDNLNPKYTFDDFIVGPFNELAYAAGQAVVKNPGKNYNPLFIYGPTGVGKTHLLQAIGNELRKRDPTKKTYYVTSERWMTDFVDSVIKNRVHLFKEKYRKFDLLIIDDIQFLTAKDKTQEELFHLFNHFHENGKQVIFSSDKPPKQIVGLEDRLRSRFEGGMQADVTKPDFESRLAILKTKARQTAFAPDDSIIEYIASVIADSIRELEGTLNAIVCQAQLKNRPLSLAEAKVLIKNNIKQQRQISIKDVIRIVAEFYNIEERVLYEKTRRKEVVKPRQVIMYILREDFNTSYPYIGQKLGGRDHTTVIHAYEKIKEDIKVDNLLNQEVEQIKNILYNTLASA
ncbi:MAG: chromosomal replication initiator protein DnaA [Patescibacteria group bacterium]